MKNRQQFIAQIAWGCVCDAVKRKSQAQSGDTGEPQEGETGMILAENQINQLNTAIEAALNELYEKDDYLIQNKVHERAIVCRFCIYFQQELNKTGFASLHLDFEYNKNHSDPKRTVNFKNGTYPDIILHQRGSNEANILIIEFKSWWDNNTGNDIQKLKDFTNQQGQYKYGMGYSIVLHRDKNALLTTLVENGEVCNG